MFCALGLIAIIIGLIYTWLSWNVDYWRKRGVPSLDGRLLTGSFPQSFFQKINLVYDVEAAYRWELIILILIYFNIHSSCCLAYRKYRSQTPYFGFFMSRRPSLMVIDPKMIKQILITNFKNFHDNLLFVRVNIWAIQKYRAFI